MNHLHTLADLQGARLLRPQPGDTWVEYCPLPGKGITSIAQAAVDNDVSEVWIADPLSRAWWLSNPSRWKILAVEADGEERRDIPRDVTARCQSPDGRIVWIHHLLDSRWGVQNHAAFIAAAEFVSVHLDRPLGWSPGWLGIALLKSLSYVKFPARWEFVEQPPMPVLRPTTEYVRQLHKLDGAYLHAYDVRSAYLSAAQTVICGYGKLLYLFPKKNDPAIHRVTESSHPALPALGYYDVAATRIPEYGGPAIGISGSDVLVWEHHWEPFRAWAETIRDARRAFGTNTEASAILKRVYLRTLGRIRQQPRRGDDTPWYYQPSWHLAMESEHARRRWKAYHENRGVALGGVDTLVIASDQESPIAAAPALNQDPARLGSYRYLWTAPNTEALRRATKPGLGARNFIKLAETVSRKQGDAWSL